MGPLPANTGWGADKTGVPSSGRELVRVSLMLATV